MGLQAIAHNKLGGPSTQWDSDLIFRRPPSRRAWASSHVLARRSHVRSATTCRALNAILHVRLDGRSVVGSRV
eukprot:3727730-Rhodomonas_salina.1